MKETNDMNRCISVESGIEKGIFFRSPIQKVFFDNDYIDGSLFSAYEYSEKVKNPIRRLFEKILGNGNIIKNIDNMINDADCIGFSANILCSPIYFIRPFRSLYANISDRKIKSIYSHGYESQFNIVAGKCDVEKTIITLDDGKKIRIKRKDNYHFTYTHVVDEIIDTGIIL